MPSNKKIMLESRLQKRLRALHFLSFDQYCDYLFTPEGQERELFEMINVITTHRTEFFREPAHFRYLQETVLPSLVERTAAGTRRPLQVWSAGCSYGDEPYTLAMVIHHFSESYPYFRFFIMASDISPAVLKSARSGIFPLERVANVPLSYKKKYLLKSKDPEKKLVKIVPELRFHVTFRKLNLMEDFRLAERYDVIFCRNVMIYFSREIQERLLQKFYRQLEPGGFLFLGHSETINGLNVSFEQKAPTVYRKVNS